MGKNKTKQVKNVFKVIGGKNTKAKNKAKPVNGQLKRVCYTKLIFYYLIMYLTHCFR